MDLQELLSRQETPYVFLGLVTTAMGYFFGRYCVEKERDLAERHYVKPDWDGRETFRRLEENQKMLDARCIKRTDNAQIPDGLDETGNFYVDWLGKRLKDGDGSKDR